MRSLKTFLPSQTETLNVTSQNSGRIAATSARASTYSMGVA